MINHNTESDRRKAVPSVPEQDLEQIIYDRIGWTRRLSLLEWDRIFKLRRRFPQTFYDALDELHSGVQNVVRFLESILARTTPETAKKKSQQLGRIVHCEKCGWSFYENVGHHCGSEHLKHSDAERKAKAQALMEIAHKMMDPRAEEPAVDLQEANVSGNSSDEPNS